MTNRRTGTLLPGGLDIARVRRLALLVPEAPILLVLVTGFVLLGRNPLVGALTSVVALSFGVRWSALLLAWVALNAARLGDAEALVRIAQAMHPWSADALALRGTLALHRGQNAQAAQLLGRSLALLPDRPAVHAAHSAALLEIGQGREAAHAARQALELNGQCAAAYLHLAQAESMAGAEASMVEDQLRAGIVFAQDPETETTLRCALAWHLVGQQRCAEARLATSGVEATLLRCTEAHRSRLRLRLCELLVAQGQTERARELLQGVAG